MDWLFRTLKFIYDYRAIFQMFSRKPVVHKETFEERALIVYNMLTSKYNGRAVEIDEALMKSAQSHAEWMNANSKLSHIGAFGKTARQRALTSGYKGMYIAEHIFICNNCDVQSAVESLLSTVAAKCDIGENFRHLGIANCGKYWCIILAR